MTTWPELEFVVRVDEKAGGQALLRVHPVRAGQARVPVLQHQRERCTGWEEIVFEMADDEALD